jgi:hypothetical protein
LGIKVVDVITKMHLLEMLALCWLNEVVRAEIASGVVVTTYTERIQGSVTRNARSEQ